MQTKLHFIHLEISIFYLGLPRVLPYAMLSEKKTNYNGSQRNTAIAKTIWRYLGIDENERVYKMLYSSKYLIDNPCLLYCVNIFKYEQNNITSKQKQRAL